MEIPKPYYLSYPQTVYGMTGAEDRLEDLYPLATRRIRPYVREAIDELDTEGNFIYDEYPDRERMKAICREIEVRVNQYDEASEPCIIDLIETIFCHEMERRRQLF